MLEKEEIYGFKFPGTRYDTGNRLGFFKANVDYFLRDPRFSNDVRKFLKSLDF